MTLGERVLVLRHRLKLSQGSLGRATGIAPNTIARLERGELQELASSRIVALAHALQVSTDVLLGVKPLDSELKPAAVALIGV
jgi:transcriptional regulator with XRE-family HTH domain